MGCSSSHITLHCAALLRWGSFAAQGSYTCSIRSTSLHFENRNYTTARVTVGMAYGHRPFGPISIWLVLQVMVGGATTVILAVIMAYTAVILTLPSGVAIATILLMVLLIDPAPYARVWDRPFVTVPLAHKVHSLRSVLLLLV